MFDRFTYSSFVVVCVSLFLGACSYALTGTSQDFTLLTPGAVGAKCDVYIEKVRYQMYPPETINVMRSNSDMIIECMAPGNRDRSMVIPATLQGLPLVTEAAGGVAAASSINGIPPVVGAGGAAWDLASNAAFQYPAVVSIDFTQAQARANALPLYNDPAIIQPSRYPMEDFGPSTVMINEDRNAATIPLERRVSVVEESVSTDSSEGDKGQLMSVIGRLKAKLTGDGGDAESSSSQTLIETQSVPLSPDAASSSLSLLPLPSAPQTSSAMRPPMAIYDVESVPVSQGGS